MLKLMVQNYSAVIDKLRRSNVARDGVFRLFLDLRSRQKALILYDETGAICRTLCQNVRFCVCLCDGSGEALATMKILSQCEIDNCSVVVGKGDQLPFFDGVFDIVCSHNNIRLQYEPEVLEGLNRVAVNQGSVYISFQLTFSRVFDRLRLLITSSGFLKNCRTTGLHLNGLIYHYPSLEDADIVFFCRPDDMSFSKESFTCKKLGILSSNRGFVFIKGGGTGLVANSRSSRHAYMLDRIKSEVESRLAYKIRAPVSVRVGSGDCNTADLGHAIVRLPQSPVGLQRCLNNFRMLKWLEHRPNTLVFPRVVAEGDVEGQRFFVETKLPGNSLDLSLPSEGVMRSIELSAFDFLSDYEWVVAEIMTGEDFVAIAQEHLERLLPFISPEDLVVLKDLASWTGEALAGHSLPLVVQHGDFKISNFISSQGFRPHLAGIIDWDLGKIGGLPFVDLFSLLTYRRKTWRVNPLAKMWEIISPKLEDEHVSLYLDRMHMDISVLKPLTLLAMIRFLNDFHYPTWCKQDPGWYETMIVRSLLPACIQSIEGKAHCSVG